MAMDVGHGYGVQGDSTEASVPPETRTNGIVKKPGFLFDCIDLCFNEGSVTCILGPNGSGKSTLLRVLTKKEQPLEGKVHHAQNVNVAHFDQHAVDDLIDCESNKVVTALSLLTEQFPKKTEQDIRGELTSFGLSPKQASTNVQFFSGGERSRLCLTSLMLEDPHVMVMDEPTSHLDVESVEALIFGLKHWNGTLVLVSHDANFLRSLEGNCYVIMQEEGKIRKIQDRIDSYLKTFRF
jgi:ATP-binding cassette, subfamily F, member 3